MNLFDIGKGPHHYNLFFANNNKSNSVGSSVSFDLFMS